MSLEVFDDCCEFLWQFIEGGKTFPRRSWLFAEAILINKSETV